MTRLAYLAILLAIAGCQKPAVLPPDTQQEIRLPVPEFSFTERCGKTVSRDDLKGKVWVASFVFTRCTGPCPQVTATIARLNSELSTSNDLRFVTFTIDPERDSLADLNKYADLYRADPAKWLFLTGPEKAMHELATKGFKILAKKSDTPKPGEEFDHSSKLAVVDKQGMICGYFDGMAKDKDADSEFQASQARLKLLIAELLKH